MKKDWKSKSLSELEHRNFGNADEAPTFLVKRCLQLAKIPVVDFDIEDLRIMIGQEFGLEYLIPLALVKLEEDLFAEGDYYPGDLLANVLRAPVSFWKQHMDLWQEVDHLVSGRKSRIISEKISLTLFESVKQ